MESLDPIKFIYVHQQLPTDNSNNTNADNTHDSVELQFVLQLTEPRAKLRKKSTLPTLSTASSASTMKMVKVVKVWSNYHHRISHTTENCEKREQRDNADVGIVSVTNFPSTTICDHNKFIVHLTKPTKPSGNRNYDQYSVEELEKMRGVKPFFPFPFFAISVSDDDNSANNTNTTNNENCFRILSAKSFHPNAANTNSEDAGESEVKVQEVDFKCVQSQVEHTHSANTMKKKYAKFLCNNVLDYYQHQIAKRQISPGQLELRFQLLTSQDRRNRFEFSYKRIDCEPDYNAELVTVIRQRSKVLPTVLASLTADYAQCDLLAAYVQYRTVKHEYFHCLRTPTAQVPYWRRSSSSVSQHPWIAQELEGDFDYFHFFGIPSREEDAILRSTLISDGNYYRTPKFPMSAVSKVSKVYVPTFIDCVKEFIKQIQADERQHTLVLEDHRHTTKDLATIKALSLQFDYAHRYLKDAQAHAKLGPTFSESLLKMELESAAEPQELYELHRKISKFIMETKVVSPPIVDVPCLVCNQVSGGNDGDSTICFICIGDKLYQMLLHFKQLLTRFRTCTR